MHIKWIVDAAIEAGSRVLSVYSLFMTISPQLKGMLLGAFIGDALALGPHWLYDRREIVTKFGRLSGFVAPASPYHPGKQAGDFTHLGDQMLVVQQSVVAQGGNFDSLDFMTRWQSLWTRPGVQSYRDKATRTILASIQSGTSPLAAASDSTEFAGPVRGIPVLVAGLARGDEEQALIASARQQALTTHRSAEAQETAAFLGRLSSALAAGLDAQTAIDGALADSPQFIRDTGRLAEAPNLASLSTGDAVQNLGQTCDFSHALPAALLVIQRHSDSFEEALIENAMAGGDSAARGILIGAVLGWEHGIDAIPEAWRNGLRQTIPGLG